MFVCVADTHAALWYLFGDPRLTSRAKGLIDSAGQLGAFVAISSISLAEIVFLVEKRRIRLDALEMITDALDNPVHVFHEAPLTRLIVKAMVQIPREAVPDLPDRAVAATALHLGVPVLSRDAKIKASAVETVW